MTAFLIFIFGLIIGSFLNVLISRLPKRKSILGFSKCPECRKNIFWYDNIPVLSFLFLKGRCRGCKSKISLRYPLIELLTGFLFFLSLLIYGNNIPFLIYILFLISILTVIAFIDLKHFIIPDSLILAGFLVSFAFIFLTFDSSLLISHFYGLAFLGGFFLLLFLVSKGGWVGFGDVKLGALLGFVFGLKSAVDVFYFTFLIGFIIAIILLSFKKAGLKTRVPLGLIMAGASILFLLTKFSLLDLINAKLYGG